MATSLAGGISAALNWNLTKTNTGLQSVSWTDSVTKAFTIADGVGANQAQLLYAGVRTIAAAGTDNVDVFGSLSDPLGTVFSAAEIKAIFVHLLSVADDATNGTACSSITIGNHATLAFLAGFGAAAHTWTILSGQIFLATNFSAAGWPSVAATSDMLKVLNNDGAVAAAYKLILWGNP